jgi:hypothetical protein
MTRTFQQMADEAYTVRRDVLNKGGSEQDVHATEFPMTRQELRAAGKRPWTDEVQATYGNRIYGLKCVLVGE